MSRGKPIHAMSLAEILAEKERKRLAHKRSSYRSRHKIDLEQARRVVAIYESQLLKEPENRALLTSIQMWREQVAIHNHALLTGKSIRPQATHTAEQLRYLEEERLRIEAGHEEYRSTDERIAVRQAEDNIRLRGEDPDKLLEELQSYIDGPDMMSDEEFNKLLGLDNKDEQ